MFETIYHVEGHTLAGGFVYQWFESLEEALACWGEDSDWQDGDVVAETFGPEKRTYEYIRRVGF